VNTTKLSIILMLVDIMKTLLVDTLLDCAPDNVTHLCKL